MSDLQGIYICVSWTAAHNEAHDSVLINAVIAMKVIESTSLSNPRISNRNGENDYASTLQAADTIDYWEPHEKPLYIF